jgi:hypothetical protein
VSLYVLSHPGHLYRMTLDMACMIGFTFRKRFVSWLNDIFLLQTQWLHMLHTAMDQKKTVQTLPAARTTKQFFWTPPRYV